MDGGFVSELEQGAKIQVLSLDRQNGVDLESFPDLWMCKSCKRVHSTAEASCPCGYKGKGQIPFVGYHDQCGALKQPYVPKCPTHKQVKIVFPGTSTASEIKFVCPVCDQLLRKGFGFPPCDCGAGKLSFNVHRSSSVYTPRNVVIVNPPTPEKIKTITDSGGRPRALSWVVSGMKEAAIEELEPTIDILRRQLLEQKIPADVVEQMVAAAAASGKMSTTSSIKIDLSPSRLEQAEDQAVTIALDLVKYRFCAMHPQYIGSFLK